MRPCSNDKTQSSRIGQFSDIYRDTSSKFQVFYLASDLRRVTPSFIKKDDTVIHKRFSLVLQSAIEGSLDSKNPELPTSFVQNLLASIHLSPSLSMSLGAWDVLR